MREKFSYEKLTVWQDSIQLVKEVHTLCKRLPQSELYGLNSQMKRAAMSIGLNIAEGKGRFHTKEFIRFLYIARGSAYELATCLDIATELNYIDIKLHEEIKDLAYKIQSKLNNLIRSLKLRQTSNPLTSSSLC